MNINNKLRGYIENNINPTSDEKSNISILYNEIKELLEYNQYYCFRSGSYARGTAINPVNDLDIICECSEQDIIDFKNSQTGEGIYKILSERYGENNIDFQSSSIGISFGDNEDSFGIDVVIALKIDETNEYGDNLYKVPKLLYKTRAQRRKIYENIAIEGTDREYLDLIKSDPKGYKKEMKNIKEKNKNIIYATRFLKKWKSKIKDEFYNGKNDKCFKSFHIEEVVKKTIKSDIELDLVDLLKTTLQNFELKYANIPDRADSLIMIDSYIDDDGFDKDKGNRMLTSLLNKIEELTEENFDEIIKQILFIQKDITEIQIDSKQKSYYAS